MKELRNEGIKKWVDGEMKKWGNEKLEVGENEKMMESQTAFLRVLFWHKMRG